MTESARFLERSLHRDLKRPWPSGLIQGVKVPDAVRGIVGGTELGGAVGEIVVDGPKHWSIKDIECLGPKLK